MSLIDSVKKLMGMDTTEQGVKTECYFPLQTELYYKKLALDSCIGLIANALLACEFQTYEAGKETKGHNYYLLNVRPNKNYNASEFWHKFVSKLVKDNEALIVMQNDEIFIADTFSMDEKVIHENSYSYVMINGFTFNKTFYESEVLHIRMNNENVARIIDGIYQSYGKLISASQSIYKRKNAMRVILDMSSFNSQDEQSQEALQNLFNNEFKAWFEADNAGAVMPLPKGLSVQNWTDYSRANSSQDTSDIRNLINDIFDFIATAFHIPVNLLRGNMADLENQINSFIMFCVKPIVELLKDEINAKMYTKTQYLNRTYVKINTNTIKVIDIVKLANAADRLFAAGVNTINDNGKMFDREEIDEWWANTHFVTKNYQQVESFKEGGGNDADDRTNTRDPKTA